MKTKNETRIRYTLYRQALDYLEAERFSCYAINVADHRWFFDDGPATDAYVALYDLPREYGGARQLEYVLYDQAPGLGRDSAKALADSMRPLMLLFAYHYFKDEAALTSRS